MSVKLRQVDLADLKPNPFRNMGVYVLTRDTIDEIKHSIDGNGFWGETMICRENDDGEVEIAFGHHRLQAAREMGITKAKVSIRPLNDTQMLLHMIGENLVGYAGSTAAIIDYSVGQVRDYIAEQIRAFPWIELPDEIKRLVPDEAAQKRTRAQGVGRNLIYRFVNGKYDMRKIRDSLARIALNEGTEIIVEEAGQFVQPPDEEVSQVDPDDREDWDHDWSPPEPEEKPEPKVITDVFPVDAHANAFVKAIRDEDAGKVIDMNEELAVAIEIAESIGSKEMTAEKITKKVGKLITDRMAVQEEMEGEAEDRTVKEMAEQFEKVIKTMNDLTGEIAEFMELLTDARVETLRGPVAEEGKLAFSLLVKQMDALLEQFGLSQEDRKWLTQ